MWHILKYEETIYTCQKCQYFILVLVIDIYALIMTLPVLWYFNIDIILSNQINRMINDIICTSTCSEELKRDAKMWLMKPNLTFPFANTGSSNTIEIKYQYLFDLYVVVELLTSYLISFWYLPYINVIIHLNLFRAVFAWFPFFYLYFLYQGID